VQLAGSWFFKFFLFAIPREDPVWSRALVVLSQKSLIPKMVKMFDIRLLPNALTLLRITTIPLFVVIMVESSLAARYMAASLFILAALTDFLDGIIARRYGVVSDLGKLLDTLADKILVMAALVMLCSQRVDITGDSIIPGWMVVLVLTREVWVTGLRGIASVHGVVVAAGDLGKLKTAMQMIAIVFLILSHIEFVVFGVSLTARILGLNLLFVSLFFSYLSGVEYTISVCSVLTKEAAPRSQS
jgi:CDP-diacylglycerol---glycerol-3-phosphate 3-phosphatidyltransferase